MTVTELQKATKQFGESIPPEEYSNVINTLIEMFQGKLDSIQADLADQTSINNKAIKEMSEFKTINK